MRVLFFWPTFLFKKKSWYILWNSAEGWISQISISTEGWDVYTGAHNLRLWAADLHFQPKLRFGVKMKSFHCKFTVRCKYLTVLHWLRQCSKFAMEVSPQPSLVVICSRCTTCWTCHSFLLCSRCDTCSKPLQPSVAKQNKGKLFWHNTTTSCGVPPPKHHNDAMMWSTTISRNQDCRKNAANHLSWNSDTTILLNSALA